MITCILHNDMHAHSMHSLSCIHMACPLRGKRAVHDLTPNFATLVQPPVCIFQYITPARSPTGLLSAPRGTKYLVFRTMADAFGIAVGVLQVADFGALVGSTLYKCARRFNHASEEFETIANQVGATQPALRSVNELLRGWECLS